MIERRTWADVAAEHPDGFRDLLDVARQEELDVLIEPMEKALQEAGV